MATADDHGNHDTDSLYRELIRTVAENDFDSMATTYHQDAVLVTSNSTSLISSVMPRWRTMMENKQKPATEEEWNNPPQWP